MINTMNFQFTDNNSNAQFPPSTMQSFQQTTIVPSNTNVISMSTTIPQPFVFNVASIGNQMDQLFSQQFGQQMAMGLGGGNNNNNNGNGNGNMNVMNQLMAPQLQGMAQINAFVNQVTAASTQMIQYGQAIANVMQQQQQQTLQQQQQYTMNMMQPQQHQHQQAQYQQNNNYTITNINVNENQQQHQQQQVQMQNHHPHRHHHHHQQQQYQPQYQHHIHVQNGQQQQHQQAMQSEHHFVYNEMNGMNQMNQMNEVNGLNGSNDNAPGGSVDTAIDLTEDLDLKMQDLDDEESDHDFAESLEPDEIPYSFDEFVPWTDDEIPHRFKCPISLEIMNEPVLCSDGFYYDHDFIVEWLTQQNRSPMTNLVLENPSLQMDVEFAKEIETWIANRWQIFQENQGMAPMDSTDDEDDDDEDDEDDGEYGRDDDDGEREDYDRSDIDSEWNGDEIDI